LKNLRKDISKEKEMTNKLIENPQNKNYSNENLNEYLDVNIINNNDKKFSSIDVDNPHNFNEKSKITIKKKKKILIAKTPNAEEDLNSKYNKDENNPLSNYKNYKISMKKNNKEANRSGNNINKSNIERPRSDNQMNKLITNVNESSNKNNLVNNDNYSENEYFRDNDSKKTSNRSRIINFASEKIETNKKKSNKINSITATEILLGDLSPNNYNNKNKSNNKFTNESNNNENFSNYQNSKIKDNFINKFDLDKKMTLDFNENGYDLENFILKQNSKKSKLSSFKSPIYKDGNSFDRLNSKNKSTNKNNLISNNNNLNENSENEFNNYNNFVTNDHEDDECDKNFSKLIHLNNQKNKMDKSMDRSFNDVSRDQIMDKINRNKKKSIMNALNKTENEIEKFDNNNMNSSVIDVVFSKIEGKNKNKHKNKENGIFPIMI